MEKLAYQLWKKESASIEQFKSELLTSIPPRLDSLLSELQINISDQDVEPATALAQSNYPPSPNAIIFIKVKSYFDSNQVEIELLKFAEKIQGFVVSESIILNDEKKSQLGKRAEGFSQIVFLEKPESMSSFDWFHHWTNHHTKIAIETQSNFIYIQNTVVRPLKEDATNFIAIIEECFPEEAMADSEVFYNAKGDEEMLQRNAKIMMDSCNQFIDFNKIEVIPTSRYRII